MRPNQRRRATAAAIALAALMVAPACGTFLGSNGEDAKARRELAPKDDPGPDAPVFVGGDIATTTEKKTTTTTTLFGGANGGTTTGPDGSAPGTPPGTAPDGSPLPTSVSGTGAQGGPGSSPGTTIPAPTTTWSLADSRPVDSPECAALTQVVTNGELLFAGTDLSVAERLRLFDLVIAGWADLDARSADARTVALPADVGRIREALALGTPEAADLAVAAMSGLSASLGKAIAPSMERCASRRDLALTDKPYADSVHLPTKDSWFNLFAGRR